MIETHGDIGKEGNGRQLSPTVREDVGPINE